MSVWAPRVEGTLDALWRLLLRLAIVAGVVFACYRLRTVITTLFVAAIIAYVLDPIVEWLCRRPGFVRFHCALLGGCVRFQQALGRLSGRETPSGYPVRVRRHVLRVYATLYVFVLAVIVLWQGTRLIVTPFVGEFQRATSVKQRQVLADKMKVRLRWYDERAPEWARSDKIKDVLLKSDTLKDGQKALGDLVRSVLESLKNVVEVMLLPVLAFYFLIDGRTLKHEFVALAPRKRIRETMRMVNEFNQIMRAFVAGQFILCILAGFIVGIGLALLRVRYPVILGVLAGITRAIPIIGPIIGGIPIILLTLVTRGIGVALAVLVFFTLLHFAESKFIMPMLIGDRMHLHPVIIIVVLLIGGEMGGLLIGGQLGALLGMFFAAPAASLARVMVRRYWLRVRARPPRAAVRTQSSDVPSPVATGLAETLD